MNVIFILTVSYPRPVLAPVITNTLPFNEELLVTQPHCFSLKRLIKNIPATTPIGTRKETVNTL